MKSIRSYFSILLCLCINAFGQSIQYTRQLVPYRFDDVVQLVPNVGNYHHLVCFGTGKSPSIYIYDKQLQLYNSQQVAFKLKDNYDVKVVPFSRFYFLYIHVVGSNKHELWKILDDGTVFPMSKKLQTIVDTALLGSTTTLQLVNSQEQLYILSHKYFDELGLIKSSVVNVDSTAKLLYVKRVSFPFNRMNEVLKQVTFMGNNLFYLKTSKDEEKGNFLIFSKVNLVDGQESSIFYNSGAHLYVNPTFKLSTIDSTAIVYSGIREPLMATPPQRSFFISLLNHLLQEQHPFKIFKYPGREINVNRFLFLDGNNPSWLNNYNDVRSLRFDASTFLQHGNYSFAQRNRNRTDLDSAYRDRYPTNYNNPRSFRFSVMNNQFYIKSDTLLVNNSRMSTLLQEPFGQFIFDGKGYMLLVQQFSRKHKGLVLVHSNPDNKFSISEINVYDRYDYLPNEIKPVDFESFVLPYTYKKELGLVKIKIPKE